MGPLTLITFLPVLGAVIIAFLPRDNDKLVRWTALVTTFIVLVITASPHRAAMMDTPTWTHPA